MESPPFVIAVDRLIVPESGGKSQTVRRRILTVPKIFLHRDKNVV